MNQPEITSKNLTIIEDQMNLEALVFKKCDAYSQYFTDPQLVTLARDMAQHHKRHFENMFNYLNSHK